MVYQCEKCEIALPAGVLNCPKCGECFDTPVPQDAEVPARGWQPKSEVEVSSSIPSQSEMKLPDTPEKLNVNAALGSPYVYNKPQKLQTPSDAKNRKSLIWLVVLVGFLIFGVIEDLTGGKGSGSEATSTSTSSSAPASAPSDSSAQNSANAEKSLVDHIGDVGVIRTGKGNIGDTVYIATTTDAFNKMSDAAQANDNVGFNQLLAEGSAFSVMEGTHAKFLGTSGITLMHVRITDGTHATEDGWIPMEWLKKG